MRFRRQDCVKYNIAEHDSIGARLFKETSSSDVIFLVPARSKKKKHALLTRTPSQPQIYTLPRPRRNATTIQGIPQQQQTKVEQHSIAQEQLLIGGECIADHQKTPREISRYTDGHRIDTPIFHSDHLRNIPIRQPPFWGKKLKAVPMTGQVARRDHHGPIEVERLRDARLMEDMYRIVAFGEHSNRRGQGR